MVTASRSVRWWPAGSTTTGRPCSRSVPTRSTGGSSPTSSLTSPRSSEPSPRPSWMSACWLFRISTAVPGWVLVNALIAGTRRVEVAAFVVPSRTSLVVVLWSPAACLSLSTASSTSTMFWSSSRPWRLIRAPERRRSSRVTPSSRSSLLTASLSAGWEMCSFSLARRREPCWVTAAMYSSCSMRMSRPGVGVRRWAGHVPAGAALHPDRRFLPWAVACRLARGQKAIKLVDKD